ncbi:MAG: ATP phosphoribosyltransferase regulatory subunit [Paracoccaceae bacterium]
MPGGVLTGTDLSAVEAVLSDLAQLFAEAGYLPVKPRHLFAADRLLDLYGEDIRTRAFLFPDPEQQGELCLRPDFTVPVALAHGAVGWDRPASYAYAGPVFRRQAAETHRPIEYLQAGVENFGALDRSTADATVFALMLRGLDVIGVGERRIETGDLGIVFALLDALSMPEHRRWSLRRHVWRPRRFQTLLETFGRVAPRPSPRRAALLSAVEAGEDAVAALALDAGEPVGLRGLDEVADRARDLRRQMDEPPLAAEQIALVEAVLALSAPSGTALSRLREITVAANVDITAALDRFEARLDALNRIGIDAEELPFSAAFGRSLEYYDGFVFEIRARGPDLPPLAGGGRYDAMTSRLGARRPVPAVGAMIRPEAAVAAGAER